MLKFALLFILSIPLIASEFDFHEPSERNVIYGMDHGSALLMDVYRPATPNGFALVFIMGTGFTAYGEYDDVPLKNLDRSLLENHVFKNYYGETRQPFGPALDRGFTVFSINHRLGPKHTWKTQVRDCQRAVQFIRHNADTYTISPDWITGMGHSSGATMITFLGVYDDATDPQSIDPINRQSSRLQAVIAAAGVHDTLLQLKDSPSGAPTLMSMIGRSISWQPPGHPIYQDYRNASTLSYVSPDDCPIFLIHGDSDQAVLPEQSHALAKVYQNLGLPVQLKLVPNANHAQLNTPSQEAPIEEAIQWLIEQSPQE